MKREDSFFRRIAYGSKVLSDSEMKYGKAKAETFPVVTFVEKYRAYVGRALFSYVWITEPYPG